MAFFVGKIIRLANWSGPLATPSGGFRTINGTLYDPATPSLKYQLPGASTVTVTGGALTHDGVGLFSYTVVPTQAGDAVAVYLASDGAYSDPVTWKVEPAPL